MTKIKLDNIGEKIQFFSGQTRDENGQVAHRSDIETFNKARELIGELSNVGNGGSKKAIVYGLVAGILREHRYLQAQTIFQLIEALGMFGQLDKEQVTDGRNQHAHKVCSRFKDQIPEVYWK